MGEDTSWILKDTPAQQMFGFHCKKNKKCTTEEGMYALVHLQLTVAAGLQESSGQQLLSPDEEEVGSSLVSLGSGSDWGDQDTW